MQQTKDDVLKISQLKIHVNCMSSLYPQEPVLATFYNLASLLFKQHQFQQHSEKEHQLGTSTSEVKPKAFPIDSLQSALTVRLSDDKCGYVVILQT